MSGLEIAGLVISAISAGAGAISAFKDAKELNGSHHQMRQVTYTRDVYGNITQATQTTTVAVFGTAWVNIGANGGVSAYSTGAGSSALGVYSKSCSYDRY